MSITLSLQNVITFVACVTAVISLIKVFAGGVRWKDKLDRQDAEIKSIKHEQTLLCFGVLACLKGLKEQGCNGPVTEAIEKIEKHLNVTAHESGGD